MYHRVLLKISGEALSSETAALCAETIDRTAATIAELHRRGVEIGIVVGGGNILRGRSASHMERNRADHMGMLATAINALALQDALEKLSVPCAVLSAIDMHRICAEYTARDAHRLLRKLAEHIGSHMPSGDEKAPQHRRDRHPWHSQR